MADRRADQLVAAGAVAGTDIFYIEQDPAGAKLPRKIDATSTAAALASIGGLATTAYVDNAVVGLFDYRGGYNASTNLYPAAGGSGPAGAVKKADVWSVTIAGTLGGAAVKPGDLIIATVDAPGQTSGNWIIEEHDFGYVPADDSLVVHKALTETVTGQKTFSLRPITAEYGAFTGIDMTGATDISVALAALTTDLAYLTVRPGEFPYIGPAAGLSLDLPNIEFNVLPGGAVRIDPTVNVTGRIFNPGARKILDTRIQNLTVTGTGTFILHGGSSTTSTGSSTSAISASGLTAATLQTAIRTLTGFGAVTVASLGGGVFQITFASNTLTNLAVDPVTTGGTTAVIKRGGFAPINQENWYVGWWGETTSADHTGAWSGLIDGINAGAIYTDPITTVAAGRKIIPAYGQNRFFGITLSHSVLIADKAVNFFYPPAWSPTSGVMLTLQTYASVWGGFWRTNGALQAVTLIQQAGQRTVVAGHALIGNRAYGSIGIQCGPRGMSGSISPEVQNIRGEGNTAQRLITISAGATGNITLRGGSATTNPINYANATPISLSGINAAALQFAARSLPLFSIATGGIADATVVDSSALYGAGTYTITTPNLALFDIDATGITGTATVECFGTCIEVNSPDAKLLGDISPAGFKYGIKSNSGAGRVEELHPFSCDYGASGVLSTWSMNVYGDTNNIWTVDAQSTNRMRLNMNATETGGFAVGGGSVRIQASGHLCTGNRITGTFDDDFNTMILLDAADNTTLDVTLGSTRYESQGQSPLATYGVHILSTCTRTKVRGVMKNSNFLARAILDEAVDSNINLGERRYVATAQGIADYTDEAATYQTMAGPLVYEALDEWDFEYDITAKGSQGADGKLRITPSNVGGGGDGRMHMDGAVNANATAGTATSIVGVNTVRLNTSPAAGLSFGTIGVLQEQTIKGGGRFRAGTRRVLTDGNLTASTKNLQSATAAFTAADVGSTVIEYGNVHIPGGTVITAFIDATHVTLSAATSDSLTGVLNFTIVPNGSLALQCGANTAQGARGVPSVSDAVFNSTTTVTSATAAFTAADVGRIITGTGIPANTYIASLTNGTTIVLSAATTLTGSGNTITIGHGFTTFIADDIRLKCTRRA